MPPPASPLPPSDAPLPEEPTPGTAADILDAHTARSRLRLEVGIVLALSLGTSAAYSILSLTAKLAKGSLSEAQAILNAARYASSWLDFSYQLIRNVTDMAPVLLVLFLLAGSMRTACLQMGFDLRKLGRDWLHAAGLAALIGIPGLGVYWLGRVLGVTAEVVPAALDDHWWQVPMLFLAAFKNGLIEEVIVVAYLANRLPQCGFSSHAALAFSAILRGVYHLYQGFGAFVGNAIMGVIFWWYYQRTGRVGPLVIAHTLLDIVAFVGYTLLHPVLPLP